MPQLEGPATKIHNYVWGAVKQKEKKKNWDLNSQLLIYLNNRICKYAHKIVVESLLLYFIYC